MQRFYSILYYLLSLIYYLKEDFREPGQFHFDEILVICSPDCETYQYLSKEKHETVFQNRLSEVEPALGLMQETAETEYWLKLLVMSEHLTEAVISIHIRNRFDGRKDCSAVSGKRWETGWMVLGQKIKR